MIPLSCEALCLRCFPTQVQPLFSKGIKGGLEELLDNSVSALLGMAAMLALHYGGMGPFWRPYIEFAFFDHEEDSKAMIAVQDNGVGGSGQGIETVPTTVACSVGVAATPDIAAV